LTGILGTSEEAAQTIYSGFVELIYLGAYVWAIVVSGKKWKTLMWMVVSLATTWLLLVAAGFVLEAVTKNENSGVFIAELFLFLRL